MGLALSLTDFTMNTEIDDDERYQKFLARQLKDINRLLKGQKLPLYKAPKEVPKFKNRAHCQGFPYSWIHYLRRALAHARQQPKKQFKPLKNNAEAMDDPLIDNELSIYMNCHLICHS